MKRFFLSALVGFFFFGLYLPALSLAAETRTVVDMRGKSVTFPKELKRVATIDDGFVESVMTHLGVIDKVSAIASWGMKRDYTYSFATLSGEKYAHTGLSTMKFLHPWLNDLQCFNAPQGNVLNFEALATSAPELVILRAGDCTVHERVKGSVAKTSDTIEAMGIPVIVITAPQGAELSSMKEEMRVLGDVFGQREKSLALASYLSKTEAMIRERTADIAEKDKAKILYLGLSPDARKKGAAGMVFGMNTPESYIIEQVVHAKNAFTGQGSGIPISAEQIYALDPDVIILPTLNGYHPPRELYEASYFATLSELKAVKNKRVYAMPWTPMNCASRVEYPLDMLVIAKAAYPEKFKDINVSEFALRFYKEVYGVDEAKAKGLHAAQILDWMIPSGF